MNAQWNAPISDRFSSLCARVFSPAAAILEREKILGTRLDGDGVGLIAVLFGYWFNSSDRCIVFYIREEITGRTLKSKRKAELGTVAG